MHLLKSRARRSAHAFTQYYAFTEPDPDGNSFQPGPTREAFVGLRILFGGH